MTEIDVMLTDYVLALICTAFSWNIWHTPTKNCLGQLFGFFFGSIAISSLLGGTVHGFFLTSYLLWTATLLCIGITSASCWLIVGYCISGRQHLSRWFSFGSILFVAYGFLIIFYTQNFVLPILNYLLPTAFIIIITMVHFLKTRMPQFLWIIIGILISIFASLIQQARIDLSPVYFDHNAFFHVLDILGLCFIFYGAKGLVKTNWSPK